MIHTPLVTLNQTQALHECFPRNVILAYLHFGMLEDHFSKHCSSSPQGGVQDGVGVKDLPGSGGYSLTQLLQEGMSRHSSKCKACNLHSAKLIKHVVACLCSYSKVVPYSHVSNVNP